MLWEPSCLKTTASSGLTGRFSRFKNPDLIIVHKKTTSNFQLWYKSGKQPVSGHTMVRSFEDGTSFKPVKEWNLPEVS